MFSNRNLMATVALVGSIHAASADEASDAVQVLSKLWRGEDGEHSMQFVGDSKTFKMRSVYRSSDGTVSVTNSAAPFRFLEEDPNAGWGLGGIPVDKPAVGVKCLFERECIFRSGVIYDPVYRNPKLERSVTYPSESYTYGLVKPSDGDNVRRVLRTLFRL